MSLLRVARNIRRPASSLAQCRRAFSSGAEEPIRTALYDLHVQLGGKIVPFAGYALPVQYKDGVVDSHNWVRSHAGLFDVSHMGQLKFTGTDVDKFIETITVVDLKNLKPHSASLSVITNEKGGIIDDCIVTKGDGYVSMVVNGACKHKDMDHMRQLIKAKFPGVKLEYFEDRSLIALQGPSAAQVLKQAIGNSVDVDQWAFMTDKIGIKVFGIPCNVNRCGYTGEDGFEISVPSNKIAEVTKKLLENPEVKPTGLAVRDSLRLEAGLCLYGHDLDENTNPVEAALMWTISERRRKEGGFIGYEPIMNAFKNGVSRKRVGMIVQGAPAREGAPIQTPDGKEVGVVTSGSFSPILKKAISMGYVQTAFSKSATKLQAVTRGKASPAEVTKLPFVPTRYHKVAPKA